jgi:hypothetical protein
MRSEQKLGLQNAIKCKIQELFNELAKKEESWYWCEQIERWSFSNSGVFEVSDVYKHFKHVSAGEFSSALRSMASVGLIRLGKSKYDGEHRPILKAFFIDKPQPPVTLPPEGPKTETH